MFCDFHSEFVKVGVNPAEIGKINVAPGRGRGVVGARSTVVFVKECCHK